MDMVTISSPEMLKLVADSNHYSSKELTFESLFFCRTFHGVARVCTIFVIDLAVVEVLAFCKCSKNYSSDRLREVSGELSPEGNVLGSSWCWYAVLPLAGGKWRGVALFAALVGLKVIALNFSITHSPFKSKTLKNYLDGGLEGLNRPISRYHMHYQLCFLNNNEFALNFSFAITISNSSLYTSFISSCRLLQILYEILLSDSLKKFHYFIRDQDALFGIYFNIFEKYRATPE
ncbi:hypothetical protein NPIL_560741 [Nephila pilipes]|uniref:Uncharacterized protein n=1 Tax=Nephila pilipes TaxID=299642 RepID=A0A8X6U826_NEPPI|nr:hypothetical protein NPIL_560741 [Nephila pilipes]